ncbi:hypothetical protein ABH920_004487 [Catenulispora sp. EB89]|uniref:hypothetical protein n=1 Tax=Catenulispora sp. EB89 TaxID=3156257 RepID=UPI003518F049
MDDRDDGKDEVLVRRAYTALQGGDTRPEAVFATLAEEAGDYRAAALAVCAAVGVPRSQAHQRWAGIGEEALSQMLPGDEAADLGVFLELAGFFDVHPDLAEPEQQARRLLEQAFAAAGGVPSGYAHNLIRKLRTGRLAEAFVSMVTYGAGRSRLTPREYWEYLLAAAELLPGADVDRFESCVTMSRQRLDQTSP